MEYPFGQRKDLMSLSKISKDEVLGRAPIQFNTKNILRTDDIDGCRSELKGFKYCNKQSFNNTNQDIIGSTSRRLYESVSKPDYSLKTQDIKGANPLIVKFETKRQGNPLNPQYNIPYVEKRPITPTKFIKENKFANEIKDLTKIQKMNLFRAQEKEIIEGSQPKKLYKANSYAGNLKVKDINNPQTFVTKRNTNPLQPVYKIYEDYGYEIGKIDGNQAKKQCRYENKINYQLATQDIEQCQTGSCYDKFVKESTRKDFRQINKIQDIDGAQSGTLKKGIKSDRCINPIQPDYKYLGDTQLQIGYRKDHIDNLIKQISKNYKKTEIF